MPDPAFVHLRLHSEYSIADGTVRIDDAVAAAAADAMPALALTALANAFGFVKFAGETESTVNLLHVAVQNQPFGQSLDEAFAGSRNMQPTL